MNVPFLVAGILSIALFLAHGLAGEFSNASRARFTGMPRPEKPEVRAAWHLVTLTLLWSTISLFVLAFSDFVESPDTVAKFMSLIFLGYGLLWFVTVAGEGPRLLTRTPHWVLALVIAALSWWGTWNTS